MTLAVVDMLQLFFLFLALAMAILAVEIPKMIHAVLALLGFFVSVGILYWLLNAPYVALFQLIVYAGAVVVLFLVVITLAGREAA